MSLMAGLSTLVMYCDVLTLNLAAAVAVINSARVCSSLVRLYGEFQRFDDIIKTRPSHSHYRLWLVVGCASLTLLFATNYYVMEAKGPHHLPVFLLHFSALAIQLQYVTVVDCIRARFQLVNERIAYELKHRRFNGLFKLTTLPAVEKITGIPEIVVDHTVGIPGLSDLHWTLCGMIQKTNDIFSWQLLAHMFSLFLHIIIAPYFLFSTVNFYSLDLLSHKSLSVLSLQIFWTIAHCINLILLVAPCSATTYEAQRTGRIICKHLNQEMRSDTRKHLETFVLQLVHHKAEFTVFGLFPLHCPILTSIAGAVTTYLVILIQFQNADDMKNVTAAPTEE